jgi:hypothetical protein
MTIERPVGEQGETFAGKLVDYGQNPKPAPINGFCAQ